MHIWYKICELKFYRLKKSTAGAQLSMLKKRGSRDGSIPQKRWPSCSMHIAIDFLSITQINMLRRNPKQRKSIQRSQKLSRRNVALNRQVVGYFPISLQIKSSWCRNEFSDEYSPSSSTIIIYPLQKIASILSPQ